MDLGKMLAEALRDADIDGGVVGHDGQRYVLDLKCDLTAAAEAFLVKVREAKRFAREHHADLFFQNTGREIDDCVAIDDRTGSVRAYGIKIDLAHNIVQSWPGSAPYPGKME